MTQPWFRLYRGLVNNAKAQRLSPTLFKAWVNLLCCTGDDGLLPPTADLAFTLRATSKQVSGWLSALVSERMLIENAGQFHANDWENHQCKSDTSNERVAAKRARDRAAGIVNAANAPDLSASNATGLNGCNVTRNAPEQSRTDTDTDTDTEKKESPNGLVECERALDRWNKFRAQTWPSTRQCELTATRRKKITARLAEHGEDGFRDALRSIHASPFLRGESGKFKATLDWMIEPSNFVKIIEGNYNDGNHSRDGPEARSNLC